MAKAYSKIKSTTCKAPTQPITDWFYTVGYTPNLGRPNPRPQQFIKDRWLEAFGFTIGQIIIIDAQQRLLIIRIEEPF